MRLGLLPSRQQHIALCPSSQATVAAQLHVPCSPPHPPADAPPRLPANRRCSRRSHKAAAVSAAAASGMGSSADAIDEHDVQHLVRAAELSQQPLGQTQPHPYAGCVLVSAAGVPLAEAFQRAQGTEPPECAAVGAAGEAARGATAYLNLETGDCHGESAAVDALLHGGVVRVVIGLRHPLPHLRGGAIAALRAAGVAVAVLGEAPTSAAAEAVEAALDACLLANEALLHRAVTRRPLGLLKYAMTLDGKIATHSGHSAWVSSAASRQQVFEQRARSDAVIVGGCTVRRDNPQLTTRRESGHQPARVVMSRTLDLPEKAKLWDVSHAPTIVATQRGARLHFQRLLRARGVEVLEFDFLTPDAVARYCYDRGFLQCLWECGGMLAAPAIAGGAIHKTMAFVAPKIIGGSRAPTPVGDLGFVEMTQALQLAEVRWQQVGPDLMLTGYLPQSGGLRALAAAAAAGDGVDGGAAAGGAVLVGSGSGSSGAAAAAPAAADGRSAGSGRGGGTARHPGWRLEASGVAEFYKAWDRYGCLSNFSPHPIAMPPGPMTAERAAQVQQAVQAAQQGGHSGCCTSDCTGSDSGGSSSGIPEGWRRWASVEHYYQAQKFAGVAAPEAEQLVAAIAAAGSPEEAAALGRRAQRAQQQRELVRRDWDAAKVPVMLAALRAKCAGHAGPRAMLLATSRNCGGRGCDASGGRVAASLAAAGARGGSGAAASLTGLQLVESSPHDFFWGRGYDGSGANMLGKLLMQVREELAAGSPAAASAAARPQQATARPQGSGRGAAAPDPRPAGV